VAHCIDSNNAVKPLIQKSFISGPRRSADVAKRRAGTEPSTRASGLRKRATARSPAGPRS